MVKQPKYQLGQRVRVANSNDFDPIPAQAWLGATGTITQLLDFSLDYPYRVKFDEPVNIGENIPDYENVFSEHELEPLQRTMADRW